MYYAAVFCPIRQPTTPVPLSLGSPLLLLLLLLSFSLSLPRLSLSSGIHHWPSPAACELIRDSNLYTTDKKLPKNKKEKKKSDATVPLSFSDLTLTTFNHHRCLLPARHWQSFFLSLSSFLILLFPLCPLPDRIDTFCLPRLYFRGPMRTP